MQRIDLISNDINALQEEKQLKKNAYDDAKKQVKAAKDEEENYKKRLGKAQQNVVAKIESILAKNHIEKPYYHGGKYNGKAMVRLMDYKHSSNVMDEIAAFILSIPLVDRCPNEEVQEWVEKFKKILSVFDGIFSIARMSCGKVKDEHISSLKNYITTAMKLWRGLGHSIAPKSHVLEDHLAEQIARFGGIGDFCEDFIEKSHQDGIIDHSRTKNSATEEMKAAQHSRREHKRLLPSVRCITKEINDKSKRYKRVRDENGDHLNILVGKEDERKSKVSEEKKKVREDALLLTTEHDGIYLQPGKKIYYQEAARKQRSIEIIQQTIRNVQQAAQKRKSIKVIQRSIRGVLLRRHK
jgi:hypothetical protein